ncbi:hypothetical protein TSAR_006885 [Trichomalopsis sarcophagae]|uniref:Uncharacterized protein n=1 Tax=Trichomalopsis sarcophagae TaxID=543379 RepID=A0A232EXF2_9HYME|nr:hypothetical protein TSAR_006885 [Trichomalopsis sarcophagae]
MTSVSSHGFHRTGFLMRSRNNPLHRQRQRNRLQNNNDPRLLAVLAMVHQNLRISTRQIERELGVPRNTAHRFKMANNTPNEVVDILITLGECGRNYRLTARTNVERFPNRRHSNARQISLNWEVGILKRELGVPRSTAHRWLQSVNHHPYDITLVQELSEAYYVLRVQFCRWACEMLDQNPDFSWNVYFSDEATFISNGCLNRHNCHYWSPENPHWYSEVLNQHRGASTYGLAFVMVK